MRTDSRRRAKRPCPGEQADRSTPLEEDESLPLEHLQKIFHPVVATLGSGVVQLDDDLLAEAERGRIVEEHVQDAVQRGARVLTGGATPSGAGWFYPPTVLTDVDHGMRIMREETFGPVLPVMAVDSLDEAVRLANDSDYGLTASGWTRDEKTARRLQREYELPMDLTLMGDELGDDLHFLVRTHYLDGLRLSPKHTAFATDVSKHHDITELLLLADVLVTDYSSVMFDFAVTGKPIVLFTYDLASYRDDLRGFYFDLERGAPGPMPATSDEVIEALRSLDRVTAEHADAYGRFRARFCDLDDGEAGRRAIEALPLG